MNSCKVALIKWCKQTSQNRGKAIQEKTQFLQKLQEEGSHNIKEISRLQKDLGALLD